MIGIYKFTNKYNRKIYIGKSVNIQKRYNSHIGNAKKGYDSHFYNALRKYGSDGFDFDVLIECPKENLNYWEKFYIRYYCSNNPDYGYNMTVGGDGGMMCDESIKKIRISSTGRLHTEEYKKYMSDWMTEHSDEIHTEEANKKNSIAHTGKKYSDETNKKKGRSGENHPFYGKNLSKEHCDSISKSHKEIPKENHPMYGKNHSEESKELIKEKREKFEQNLKDKGLKRKRIYDSEGKIKYIYVSINA